MDSSIKIGPVARQGWGFPATRDIMAELGVVVADNTIRTCMNDGKRECAKVAVLTEAQVDRLWDLYRRYA